MWSPMNALSALVQHLQGSTGNNSELAQQQLPRWVFWTAACNLMQHTAGSMVLSGPTILDSVRPSSGA